MNLYVPLEMQPLVSTFVLLKGFRQSACHTVFQSVYSLVSSAEVMVYATIPVSATSVNIADGPTVFLFP